MMYLRYLSGAVIALPLLPLLYSQGKHIRAAIPQLPEATGTAGTVKRPNAGAKPLRLLAIGESTIAGVGVATHADGFTGTLADELSQQLQRSIDWKVYARSGYTVNRITQKLLPKIEETSADLIVIGLGGNDAFTLNRPWKWAAQLRSLIEATRIKFPEAQMVFINMPPIKEFPAFTRPIKFVVGNLVEILGQTLEKVVADYEKVYYCGEVITIRTWVKRYQLQEVEQDFFSDGVHPSKLTYQTWAKDVAGRIVARLLV